jgi:hypothetical protein
MSARSSLRLSLVSKSASCSLTTGRGFIEDSSGFVFILAGEALRPAAEQER